MFKRKTPNKIYVEDTEVYKKWSVYFCRNCKLCLDTVHAVYDILRSPVYTGAFVYGRRQVDPARQQAGRPDTGRIAKPMNEWIHIQQDVYPAYITWEQYLANQQRLHHNATRFIETIHQAQGAVCKGAALLQGLATCGYWV